MMSRIALSAGRFIRGLFARRRAGDARRSIGFLLVAMAHAISVQDLLEVLSSVRVVQPGDAFGRT